MPICVLFSEGRFQRIEKPNHLSKVLLAYTVGSFPLKLKTLFPLNMKTCPEGVRFQRCYPSEEPKAKATRMESESKSSRANVVFIRRQASFPVVHLRWAQAFLF